MSGRFAQADVLSLLLDECGQAVLAVAPQSLEVRYANGEAARLLGGTPAQLVGMRITEIETGLQDHFFWEEVAAGTARELIAAEAQYRDLRGQVRPVERSVRRCAAAGEAFYLVTARDIALERANEDLAARTASLLAATLESMADGILVLDLEGEVRNFNRRFTEMFGISASLSVSPRGDEALSMMRTHFRLPANWDAALAAVLEDPARHRDFTFALDDGRNLDCAARPQLLRGHAVGVLFCFLDVTDRARYQQALIAAKEVAETANRAKSQFLSSMSHELKTPLNAILGFTQLLEFDRHPEQEDSLRTIRQAGDHLLSLINEVLDLARIEAGRIELHIQELEVREILSQALAIAQPALARHGVTLDSEIAPSATQVMADPLRLRQILINLLSNAAKYNRPGGEIHVRVTPASLPHGPAVSIAIADNGIGIADADLPRLFQPFSRLENTRERTEGTGLGLALTLRLAELMRGSVKVESELGNGSTFQLLLPAG
ncbi:ATP-binding protein [Niveibacterium sp. SC-1]|uniref:PAS domain-containing sensor histidine kinase n=1 Tax=Niveibacterium sp. SC-1 TaxID=3135646 RepID=UPI0031201F66